MMTKSYIGSLVLVWLFPVIYWHYHQSHMLALVPWMQGYCSVVTFFSWLSFVLGVLWASVHQRLGSGIF